MLRTKKISIEKRARVEIPSIGGHSEFEIARKLQIYKKKKMGCIIASSDMQKAAQMLTEKDLEGLRIDACNIEKKKLFLQRHET